MAKRPPTKVHWEVLGFVWLGAALLTLLSILSYDPHDIAFNTTNINVVKSNFVGPVGNYWAGGLFVMIGLATYMVPIVMFAASTAMFLQKEFNWFEKAAWTFSYFFSLSCLLSLQTFFGMGLKNRLNLFGVGGIVGDELDQFFTKFLGQGGWTLMMLTLFIISFIFLFGIHPVQLGRELYAAYQDWQESRREKELLKDGPSGQLEIQKRRLEKEMDLLKKAVPSLVSDKSTAKIVPEKKSLPKIIDTAGPAPTLLPTPELKPKPEEKLKAVPPANEKKEKEKPKPTKPSEILRPAPIQEIKDYKVPPTDLLESGPNDIKHSETEADLQQNAAIIISKLKEFGVDARPGDITRGNTITRYELYPAPGIRVDRIRSLQDDLALALRAEQINILAPIPGKDTVGIEIPNISKVMIRFRDLIESKEFTNSKARLPIAIGKDLYGKALIADLAEMPHLLVAGTTGSGKSVVVNCILLSLLYRFSPQDLHLIIVDPKVVELQMFNPLPHLLTDVVTEPKNVVKALRQVVFEMEKRYQILAKSGVKNIVSFNNRTRVAPIPKEPTPLSDPNEIEEDLFGEKVSKKPIEIPDRLPYIVVIIDELADLMQTASSDVESLICRIAQKARAAGIHLILATQSPRKDVVTGLIKANIPSRIALKVNSGTDSRIILDEQGAENLVGKGDLLYLAPGAPTTVRAQGAYVDEKEIPGVIDFITAQVQSNRDTEFHAKLNNPDTEQEEIDDETLDLCRQSFQVMREEKKCSASLFQRQLRIGYNTAARVVYIFEKRNVIGPADSGNSAKPREILIDLDNPPSWLL